MFGGVSEVIHYNCFAGIFSVLDRKIFGLPVLNYFDDIGPLVPDLVNRVGLQVFLGSTSLSVPLMKGDKSKVDKGLTFLGIWGEFPCPDNDMLLRISLHAHKKAKWADIAHDFAPKGDFA